MAGEGFEAGAEVGEGGEDDGGKSGFGVGARAGDSAAMLTSKETRRRRAENLADAGFAMECVEFGLNNVGSEIETAVTNKGRKCM